MPSFVVNIDMIIRSNVNGNYTVDAEDACEALEIVENIVDEEISSVLLNYDVTMNANTVQQETED